MPDTPLGIIKKRASAVPKISEKRKKLRDYFREQKNQDLDYENFYAYNLVEELYHLHLRKIEEERYKFSTLEHSMYGLIKTLTFLENI